jgi:hypothetical protein
MDVYMPTLPIATQFRGIREPHLIPHPIDTLLEGEPPYPSNVYIRIGDDPYLYARRVRNLRVEIQDGAPHLLWDEIVDPSQPIRGRFRWDNPWVSRRQTYLGDAPSSTQGDTDPT